MIGAIGTAARLMTGPRARRFRAALEEPKAAQTAVLQQLVGGLSQTAYGRAHGLTPDASYADFTARVPIVDYAALEPFVAEARNGQPDVLWPGRPAFWRQTSGSTKAAKHVPVSPTLRRAFNDMVRVWAHDLLSGPYRPRTGKLFMSLSPPGEESLLGDADYLNGLFAPLVCHFLLAPKTLEAVTDPAAFRRLLAAALLAEADLEVISIWSPTYLLVLLDEIERDGEGFARALTDSQMTVDGVTLPLPEDRERRAQFLIANKIDWSAVWPRLQLISCWASAAAEAPAKRLRALFPNALVQGKGLVATEGPVTVPLVSAPAPVPLLDSVFLEFEDGSGSIHRLHELEEGADYEVIMSPPGGFARYRLGDRVRVTGRLGNTSCLAFLGRTGAVSDLVGEKLEESFVSAALSPLLDGAAGTLVPDMAASRYVLLTDAPHRVRGESVDAALSSAYHFRRARKLGQLATTDVVYVPALRSVLTSAAEARGQRWGDIKDRALVTRPEQAEALLSLLREDALRSRVA